MKDSLSLEELRDESGAPLDIIEWLSGLGILKPVDGTFVAGDVFRIRMIQALLDAGFARDVIAAAVEAAGLNLDHVDGYVFHVSTGRSVRSFGEVAEELRVADVSGVYQLMGMSAPRPDDHLTTDEEDLLTTFVHVWDLAEDADAPRRAARLLGLGMETIVSGWADLLYEQVAGPARERWLRREVEEYPSEAANAAMELFSLLPRILPWLAQRYVERLVTTGIADTFEEVLASRGLAPEPSSTDPPAIVFVDLSGYTRATDEQGDRVAIDLATALQLRAEVTSAEHDGRIIKMLGDGVMMQFGEPAAAVDATKRLVTTLRDAGVKAHAGIHAGRVIERDRDVFGAVVNVASRIAGQAREGEVLVSESIVTFARLTPGDLEDRGNVALKGVKDRVRLFR